MFYDLVLESVIESEVVRNLDPVRIADSTQQQIQAECRQNYPQATGLSCPGSIPNFSPARNPATRSIAGVRTAILGSLWTIAHHHPGGLPAGRRRGHLPGGVCP